MLQILLCCISCVALLHGRMYAGLWIPRPVVFIPESGFVWDIEAANWTEARTDEYVGDSA
jgi:hypothetical protein